MPPFLFPVRAFIDFTLRLFAEVARQSADKLVGRRLSRCDLVPASPTVVFADAEGRSVLQGKRK